MARKRKRRPADCPTASWEHRPFKHLAPATRDRPDTSAPVRAEERAPAPAPSDADLFLQALDHVVPLDGRRRQRVGAPPPAGHLRPPVDEDAEALAELSDLVAGKAEFDIADTDEYLEGAASGVAPQVVRKLRRGQFVVQAHLDLHGLTSDPARAAVDRFLLDAYRGGHRCVLIVHGRGRNSKDQIPVLKTRLKTWLAHGQWSRLVLAFTSARACDGGTGALYVLLRRHRSSKRTIAVTEGAKC